MKNEVKLLGYYGDDKVIACSEHAQVEIRDIAWEMFRLVEDIEGNPFEHTLKIIKP